MVKGDPLGTYVSVVTTCCPCGRAAVHGGALVKSVVKLTQLRSAVVEERRPRDCPFARRRLNVTLFDATDFTDRKHWRTQLDFCVRCVARLIPEWRAQNGLDDGQTGWKFAVQSIFWDERFAQLFVFVFVFVSVVSSPSSSASSSSSSSSCASRASAAAAAAFDGSLVRSEDPP